MTEIPTAQRGNYVTKMPAVFHHRDLEEDISVVLEKYTTIRDDLEDFANLIRDGVRTGSRLRWFYPAWVFRVPISISALGPHGEERCSLIFEIDGNDCTFLMLYDNDRNQDDKEVINKISVRRET